MRANGNRGKTTQGANGIRDETTRYQISNEHSSSCLVQTNNNVDFVNKIEAVLFSYLNIFYYNELEMNNNKQVNMKSNR
jgi:hypothetical protein